MSSIPSRRKPAAPTASNAPSSGSGEARSEPLAAQELESLQGQVIRQERLAAVGQLVSGVAHEINNPLQAILGFAELLQMQKDVPEGVKGDLRLIQKESARACGIIEPGTSTPRRRHAPGWSTPSHPWSRSACRSTEARQTM